MKVSKSLQRRTIWTLLVGSAFCAFLSHSKAQMPNGTPSSSQNQIDDLQIASGRLLVHPPAHPLLLGEKNPIEITLKDPHVTCLMAIGGTFVGDGDNGCSQVQRHPDGTTYVEVVPTQLGEMELAFMVVFADHALENESIHIAVVPFGPPQRLDVGMMMNNGQSIKFLMVGESFRISGEAKFRGVDSPVTIPEKDLKYRVIQTKGIPAIRFDPSTGTLVAERVGDALIESSYAGTQQMTCVMVREHWGYTPGNCEELREGGNGILPTARGADAPGADANSRLPYVGCHPYGQCITYVTWVDCTYAKKIVCDDRRGRFIADDRLEIVPPTHPFNVAEFNTVTLKTHGAKVARVGCSQHCLPISNSSGTDVPTLGFQEQPDGNNVVQIFPWESGSVHYDLAVYFVDGGVARKTLDTNVGFGSKNPRGINLSCGSDSYPDPNLPIFLFLPDTKLQAPATPWINACYEGVKSSVQLPTNLITSRILGDDENPVVTVNPTTGLLTPLRTGEALLEREFRGLKTNTCVVVLSPGERRKEAQTYCHALRTRYGVPTELPVMINPHD